MYKCFIAFSNGCEIELFRDSFSSAYSSAFEKVYFNSDSTVLDLVIHKLDEFELADYEMLEGGD